jgi:VanZ family protein
VSRLPTIPVGVAAALLVASVVNPRWLGPASAAAGPDLSLVAHVVGYAALAAVVVGPLGGGRRGVVAAVVLATGYGAGMELLHLGLAYRTASVVDLAANGVGAAAGAAAWLVRRRLSASSRAVDDG